VTNGKVIERKLLRKRDSNRSIADAAIQANLVAPRVSHMR